MLPLAGAPMLMRQIERLQRSRSMDRLIVATSDLPEDDCVAELAESAGAGSFRGDLNDVLDRFYQAALARRPQYVVRVTGDCPLIDWELLDDCVRFALEGNYDYASNALRPTWPDGLDVEVMTFAALEQAWKEADRLPEREHVTLFINRRPERFRLGSMESDVDHSAMRWTVDEPRDYEFVREVYDALYPANPAFTTADVLALLAQRPELRHINTGNERNEGLRKTDEGHRQCLRRRFSAPTTGRSRCSSARSGWFRWAPRPFPRATRNIRAVPRPSSSTMHLDPAFGTWTGMNISISTMRSVR
jgi:spore coat polysaccharide biosynthesis protein SpsF